MESAKAAVKNFLHKSGKEDTEVHQSVAPAVKHENIERQQKEEVTTAVDKEVHQDHYHTTVQPIADSEVLPEQHHHRAAAVERREFDHDNTDENQRRLHAEASKFQNETTRTEGASTIGAGGVAAGQHTHHHIHETIQPVIEKRTIEPHVVHTTVPVHEVHHNKAMHHDTSVLPTVSLDEFNRNGGALSGRETTRTSEFAGEPKLASTTVGQADQSTGTTAGTTGTTGTTGTSGTSTTHKPSLMDKLNPRIDADGDGKKGFMD